MRRRPSGSTSRSRGASSRRSRRTAGRWTPATSSAGSKSAAAWDGQRRAPGGGRKLCAPAAWGRNASARRLYVHPVYADGSGPSTSCLYGSWGSRLLPVYAGTNPCFHRCSVDSRSATRARADTSMTSPPTTARVRSSGPAVLSFRSSRSEFTRNRESCPRVTASVAGPNCSSHRLQDAQVDRHRLGKDLGLDGPRPLRPPQDARRAHGAASS